MSPSGASAAVYAGEDTAVTYLVGSKAEVDLGDFDHAYLTRVSGSLGQWGIGYNTVDDEYVNDPSWLTLSGSVSISDSDDQNNADDLDGIGVTASAAGSVTILPYEDANRNGVPDVGEDQGALITVTFVDFASTALFAVPTSNLVAKGTSTTFGVALLAGGVPVERDDQFGAGPYMTDPSIAGSYTLPGAEEAAAATKITGYLCFVSGDLEPEQCEQWIDVFSIADVGDTSGAATVSAFVDPTGGDGTSEAAKTASGSFNVSSQVFNEVESSVSVAGAGLIAPLEGGTTYLAPLTTKTTTWTWSLFDTEDPSLPMANANVVVDFYDFDDADVFKVNGGTPGPLPDTVKLKTNASGQLVVTVEFVGTPDEDVYFGAWITSINGADVTGATTLYAEVDWEDAGNISTRFSTLSMVAPAGISVPAGTVVPLTDFFPVSVLANTDQTFQVAVKDSFGNPVSAAAVTLQTDDGDFYGTSNASGIATITVPGQAAGTDLLVYYASANNGGGDVWPIGGTAYISFRTAAQLAASSIEVVEEASETQGIVTPTGGPLFDSAFVLFHVDDSNGDHMSDYTAGLLSVSGGVAYITEPGGETTIADGKTVTASVTIDGNLAVWVATDRSGPVTVTLSIGGKRQSHTVNFVSVGPIEEFSISPAAGGEVPSSVPSNTNVAMKVSASDAMGNPVVTLAPIQQVRVNMIGAATNGSGGQESLVFMGPSGTASFNVKSGAYGSFEVTATLEIGFWFMGAGEGWEPQTLTATTGEIEISKSITIKGERISAKRVEITGKAKGFAPGSEIKVKFVRGNGKKITKTVEVDENQRYTAKAKVGINEATAKTKGDGVKSKKIKV